MCPPPAAARDAVRDGFAANADVRESVWMAAFGLVLEPKAASLGGGDWVLAPPIAKTCSCEAVPPLDEVGVPPTVTATNSVPPAEKTVGPVSIFGPVSSD